MKNRLLPKKTFQTGGPIHIGGSKSISNRLLILNALLGDKLTLKNLSASQDTKHLLAALKGKTDLIDIGHAGTAMRFLTAYFAVSEGREVILTGSERMQQRPIGPLVVALRQADADIEYTGKEGYPPLKIVGKKLNPNEIKVNTRMSSQYLTALLLVAPSFSNGAKIKWSETLVSAPYVRMTLDLLESLGVNIEKGERGVHIGPFPGELKNRTFRIESDWSSASYYYSAVALVPGSEIRLSTFFEDSLQGDSAVAKIYSEHFGVDTVFEDGEIRIHHSGSLRKEALSLDLIETPDLAQTIAVTAAALKRPMHLSGLRTLKIKETDRLAALQAELAKLGAHAEISEDTLTLNSFSETEGVPLIKTYQDHRMAMAFAPLSFVRAIEIEDPDVVRKSYPGFWEDFLGLG